MRFSNFVVELLGWLRFSEITLLDDRFLTGGLEFIDKKGDIFDLVTGRLELVRFLKDLIFCFIEKNEVDLWG